MGIDVWKCDGCEDEDPCLLIAASDDCKPDACVHAKGIPQFQDHVNWRRV